MGLRGLAAALVAGTAFAGLAVGAVHGVRGTIAQSSDRQEAAWRIDTAYWSCLDTQARSLVRPGERVTIADVSGIATGGFETFVLLEKLLGPWAVITSDGPRSRARAEIGLAPRRGAGGCLGMVVTARFDGPRGRFTVLREGTGASLRGDQQELPMTPL